MGMMSILVFLHLLNLFCYLVPLANSQQPFFLSANCNNTIGNFTSKSSYETNLKTFISSITSTPTEMNNGFYEVTLGNNPDDIFNGIALCRGDITADSCTDCLMILTSELPQHCPTQKEAIIWYKMCMLRYSNRSIIGVYEESPNLLKINSEQVSMANPSQFDMVRGNLLQDLQNRAPQGNSTLKFATGEAKVGSLVTVYALAQCTPDLSAPDCYKCLGDYISMLAYYTGNQGGRYVGPSCNVRYEVYLFYNLNGTTSPPSSTSSNATTTGSGKRNINTSTILIVVAIATFFTIANLLAIVFCLLFRRKFRWTKVAVASSSVHGAEDDENRSVVESLQFKFDTIKVATRNFSNKLGSGGFGTVYKGKLANGKEIAVKRLSQNSSQGDAEFKNEVLIVAKLQHRNLVKLLGFCLEREEMLLVYEFVPNASLDYYLFDPVKRGSLHWGTRYKILVGTARGLPYMKILDS